jgi:CTP:molybdopterin cytidylyltransferase MocA
VSAGAIVLAAGASTRLGEAKQLAVLGDERLLERAVRIANEAGLAPVIVVLGCRAEEIRASCRLGDATVVLNPDWAEGMASSVRAGIAALPGDLDGIVLMTCDQPAVTGAHLHALLKAAETNSGLQVVSSRYANRQGVPAFFPAAAWADLRSLRGDQGARGLLGESKSVELDGGQLDVDTAESLELARQRYG